MSKTFDLGKEEVARLCKYFATNREPFRAQGVKEAHVRQSLIDPFFEALGWDVRNTAMAAPQYREVVPEDSLDVEGEQKAPDYTFRVGTLPKFYTEAKKCGVNIHADPAPAFQLRRYGWSGKVAASILTDFEELGVYDCTSRPRPNDKASHARILYFSFEEYPDRWREIWDVFSREAVWSGAFDQYAASKRKRGTSEVDVEFLKEIEGWREELAKNMALRNAELSADDLNAAVQRTIDRVVFLRMAEDRGLEPYEQLLKLCERPEIYPRFMRDLCRKTDEKYNSGLFHFQQESGVSESPDRITPKLSVDDKVFKSILQSLYFAYGSPYHFGVMPVEILGTVYERFLGKVIRLTAGHQAKIEEKPEVRKAGGVYYTPAYIVEYIVKQTVGRQIDGKSPAQLAGGKGKAPVRVLDMACGSGSFLLGAYQCLMDHSLKWYIEHKPEANKKAVFKDPRNGQLRLTIEEKKRILTTHLFGVDVDPQAVEVSKLSLLLKALEGETDATLSLQLELFHDRALPNLADNIKCGNSLIGSDYFAGSLIPDAQEIKRINPFDWKTEFPDAMNVGGFDCVIGNPPYGYMISEQEQSYYRAGFKHQDYQLDNYLLFVEKSLTDILKPVARFGMIIPNPWLTNLTQRSLRKFVVTTTTVDEIVHFAFPVFPKVVVDTEIVLLSTPHNPKSEVTAHFASLAGDLFAGTMRRIVHSQEDWIRAAGDVINISVDRRERELATKLSATATRLDELMKINVGIKPYQVGKGHPPQTRKTVDDRPFDADRIVDATYRACLRGSDIKRFVINPEKPRYLSYGPWLAEPRPAANFDHRKKIVMRQTGDSLVAALDNDARVCLNNMHVLVPQSSDVPVEFILGVINSRLLNWYYQTINPERGEALAEVKRTHVASLPIRIAQFPSQGEHFVQHFSNLVESILSLHKQNVAEKSTVLRDAIQRQISATDAAIDRLVYDLYGLMDEEIAIVEAKGR